MGRKDELRAALKKVLVHATHQKFILQRVLPMVEDQEYAKSAWKNEMRNLGALDIMRADGKYYKLGERVARPKVRCAWCGEGHSELITVSTLTSQVLIHKSCYRSDEHYL